MQHVDVQRQIGSPVTDCGLFSIASAICLCNKLDPHAVGFDQSKIRGHFVDCIEQEKFTQFPAASGDWDLETYTRKMCRFTAHAGVHGKRKMWLRVNACKEWYHIIIMMCCNINIEVFNSDKTFCVYSWLIPLLLVCFVPKLFMALQIRVLWS